MNIQKKTINRQFILMFSSNYKILVRAFIVFIVFLQETLKKRVTPKFSPPPISRRPNCLT